MTVNAGAGQEGGTPFTQVGVRELRRLEILTMVIPTGCAVGAEVVQGILTGFIKLQIRLLSIDKQNSYAIIAVKENDNKRE